MKYKIDQNDRDEFYQHHGEHAPDKEVLKWLVDCNFIGKEAVTKKETIIKELAKLEMMDWTKDEKIAESIFPYVLVEAINLLMNSKIIDTPIDYFSSGEITKKMLKKLTTKAKESK